VAFQNLTLSVDAHLAILTINRPEKRNALDLATIDEIHAALGEIRKSDSRCLILTGAGEKVFVSGADIGDLLKRTKFDALAGINNRCFEAVARLEIPVIAAVNGFALGGGFELALACDIRVAAKNALFGFPETSLGIFPAAGGTQRLPRLIGYSRASEMILTGRLIDAVEAERIGLTHATVEPAALMERARQVAGEILKRAPLAVRLAKQSLRNSLELPLAAGLEAESALQAITFESDDKKEGMTAFLEKRPPRFTGR
jgi:enoyl-CoA hydratase